MKWLDQSPVARYRDARNYQLFAQPHRLPSGNPACEDNRHCGQELHTRRAMKKLGPVVISPEAIAPLVHWLRHEKVMLDSDLAELYGVPTKVLNQAVKRNADRFPADFMFQITTEEAGTLRSQSVTLKDSDQNLKSQIVTSKSAPAGVNRSQIVTGCRRLPVPLRCQFGISNHPLPAP